MTLRPAPPSAMTTAPPPDSQHDVTPSGTSVQSSHSEKRPSKIPDIAAACRAQDIPALVALAKSPDGLVSDAARRQACMSPPLLYRPQSH